MVSLTSNREYARQQCLVVAGYKSSVSEIRRIPIIMVARILIKKHPFREIEASLSQIWLKPDNSGVSL